MRKPNKPVTLDLEAMRAKNLTVFPGISTEKYRKHAEEQIVTASAILAKYIVFDKDALRIHDRPPSPFTVDVQVDYRRANAIPVEFEVVTPTPCSDNDTTRGNQISDVQSHIPELRPSRLLRGPSDNQESESYPSTEHHPSKE
jgi:hypothetical protein